MAFVLNLEFSRGLLFIRIMLLFDKKKPLPKCFQGCQVATKCFNYTLLLDYLIYINIDDNFLPIY